LFIGRWLFCCAVLFGWAWPAHAQFETGSITGTVQDKSGGVLPGVTVTVRNTDTNVSQTTVTNDSGAYEFFTLRVGRYEIKAELAGFTAATVHEIALAIGNRQRVDVTLVGGLRDDRTATQLVSAKLPRRGAVLDLETDPVMTALGERVATDIAIEVPGASWVYPRRIASARAGTRVMVYARGIAGPTVDVIVGGYRQRLQILRGMPPLVDYLGRLARSLLPPKPA
jgi:hypothetical protein